LTSRLAPDGPRPALAFRNASFGYDRRPVLEGLDGTIGEGEVLALVGPNGAGKSTLLKGIVGQARRLSGSVDLCGRDVRELAYLPQQPEIDRSFPITSLEFAATGLWRRLGPWRRYRREHYKAVEAALGRVGLDGLEEKLIGSLSGGQMQRLLFARTLLQDAPVMLLDEPFAAIDADTETDLLGVIRQWQGEGRTVVAALHDFAQVRSVFPRTLLLAGRPVAWGPTGEVLAPASLARASRQQPARSGHARAAQAPFAP
jgi:zinc/manganese transport system ATP-binding protein